MRACHDLSEGGLAVAAAEMCLAGRLGLRLDLQAKDALLALFGETNGCLLVEVRPSDTNAFENRMAGLPVIRLGQVTAEPFLTIHIRKQNCYPSRSPHSSMPVKALNPLPQCCIDHTPSSSIPCLISMPPAPTATLKQPRR